MVGFQGSSSQMKPLVECGWHIFRASMIERCQRLCAHAVRVPISQATRADVRCVMASLTFDIVNGDEYAESMEDESLKLPKPDGVPFSRAS